MELDDFLNTIIPDCTAKEEAAAQPSVKREYIRVSLKPRSRIIQTLAKLACGLGIIAGLAVGGNFMYRSPVQNKHPAQAVIALPAKISLDYGNGYKASNSEAKVQMNALITTINEEASKKGNSCLTKTELDSLYETIDSLVDKNNVLEPKEIAVAKAVMDIAIVYNRSNIN